MACATKDYGTGADCSLGMVEIDAAGHISIHGDAVEMGNGIGTALANRVAAHLGGVADEVTVAQVDVFGALELVTSGEETELDKTVIERLNDPLIHLIRNAVDHGIEDPATRAASGKAPLGRITLAATHVGSGVLISIGDDGRGLDRAPVQV